MWDQADKVLAQAGERDIVGLKSVENFHLPIDGSITPSYSRCIAVPLCLC